MKDIEKIIVVKNLLRLGAYLQREGSRLLSGFGLNQQQFVVLKEIQEKEPISQKEICSELLFEKSNVSKIIKKLIIGKLVKISYAAGDGRLCLLSTTKKGTLLIDQCMTVLNNWNKKWLKSLTGHELKEAVKILDRLNRIKKGKE